MLCFVDFRFVLHFALIFNTTSANAVLASLRSARPIDMFFTSAIKPLRSRLRSGFGARFGVGTVAPPKAHAITPLFRKVGL